MIDGVELTDLARQDECCGFGGTFSVTEESVSCSMGNDRVNDNLAHGSEVITSTDPTCVMHMDGLSRRNKQPIKVMHIAELLNGATLEGVKK